MCVRGKQQLDLNASRILGDPPTNRYTRIMVTLPSKAAKNEAFVEELLSQGMNVARINCAHDNEEVWLQMIENIRKAEQKLNKSCKILMDIAGPKIRIERLLTTHKNPRVQIGDRFFLTDKNSLKNFYGASIVAGISFKNIIPKLKFGDPVLFDDGTVEGIVSQIFDEGVMVEVERVKSKKVSGCGQKGLTFPETDFKLDILTEKDKKDLDFVCEYADIIGVSFVKDVKDIRQIQQEINNRVTEPKASEMALMLKIETVEGVVNLPELLVAAAGKNPTAVMIARGDLAVEAGYLQLAEFQPIIINLCEAADVPVVWATQVLENLMKTGIPTRAEITDAAEAAIAECVMLNKGEYVLDGIKFLADLLEKGSHQYKRCPYCSH